MVVPSKANRAYFTTDADPTPIPVCFNPATLEYSISVNAQPAGGKADQTTGANSAKLSLELIFDTTDTGSDVRKLTRPVEQLALATPSTDPNAPPAVTPNVTFTWGVFTFSGIIDSFKQTMDFFSGDGVPLRAAISLTISQPKYIFPQDTSSGTDGSSTAIAAAGSASSLALLGGDPLAARSIATLNGLASLRVSAGGGVALGGAVTIGAAAGFSASAGAGIGFGASAGAGLNLSVGASAGFSAGANAGFSGGVAGSVGGSASAGVSATNGAFAGLRTDISSTSGKYFNPAKAIANVSAPAASSDAVFDVTGRALAPGPSSFSADVGASGTLRFDGS